MCGIAGMVNPPVEHDPAALLERMNTAQRHRGPDGAGIWCGDGAALGHRRLAVIDLAGGAQPMFNEDRSLVVVFNGEIYNYRELRNLLAGRGHHLATDGDTEVLLHLYEEFGERLVEHLSGMFAFALYDRARRRLLLGRDRLGKKPLLYFRNGSELVFASEFAALREHPDFPRELNYPALGDYLSLQYVPGPETAFCGVYKLPPAHTLLFEAQTGRETLRRYWQPDFSVKAELTPQAAAAELRELLTRSVRRRLQAEVPNGAFLSGGLDSTLVAGLMTQLRAPEPTEVFTIGFEDPAYDERAAAERAATHLNRLTGGALRPHQLVVQPADFALLEELVRHYGEPFADASMLPTALLCRFARERLTVCLSGDGADELFAGYERYWFMRQAARCDRLPATWRAGWFRLAARMLPTRHGERSRCGRLRRALLAAAAPAERRYFQLLDRCCPDLKQELWRPESRDAAEQLLRPVPTAADATERLLELDLQTYLPNDILVKVDIAAMASSLEVRCPFLDQEVVEFAARLPFKFKLRGRDRKHLLKLAFPELLPPESATAPKRGFGVPLGRWLRGAWREETATRLLEGELRRRDLIAPAALERTLAEHLAGGCDHSYVLFNLLVLELFLEFDAGLTCRAV